MRSGSVRALRLQYHGQRAGASTPSHHPVLHYSSCRHGTGRGGGSRVSGRTLFNRVSECSCVLTNANVPRHDHDQGRRLPKQLHRGQVHRVQRTIRLDRKRPARTSEDRVRHGNQKQRRSNRRRARTDTRAPWRYASPRSASINSAAVPAGRRMAGHPSAGSPASSGGRITPDAMSSSKRLGVPLVLEPGGTSSATTRP